MGLKIKTHIASKILDCLKEPLGNNQTLQNSVYGNLRVKCDKSDITICLPLSSLGINKKNTKVPDFSNIEKDSIIENISTITKGKSEFLAFFINKSHFISSCLKEIEKMTFPTIAKEHIVVEYSSPNIAKPFHVGHFRSTIIGNFIANISKFTQNDIVRLNYLGDWGTQIGLLKIGLKILNISDDQIKENPIQILYQAYVKGNAAADENSALYDEAREEFNKLEKGDGSESSNSWQSYKNYTVLDFMKTYDRLNVTFDEYCWESNYAAHRIRDVLNELNSVATVREDGLQVVELNESKVVPVLKSDGSTLYLTRDIAAAIDRHKKYNFSKMLYVTDKSQSPHFDSFFQILERMNYSWAKNLMHVKFGRIRGMSTRKGQAVFLKDVLDEGKLQLMERQKQSPNIKDSSHSAADDLGISSVIIYDLKQRRTKDYDFSWDKALETDGDTGNKLQYHHCRLVSLEQQADVPLPQECDPSVLMEPEAVALVAQIAIFDETILKSYSNLEACVLVSYLFQLCNCASKAYKVLRLKDEPSHIASQRLLLFHTTRIVLSQGMKILGLKPLDFM